MTIKITKYHASWCAPCRAYDPIFKEAVKDKDYEVQEIDVDTNLEAVAANRVGMIPLTVVEGPRGSKRRTGVLDATKIQELVQSVQ